MAIDIQDINAESAADISDVWWGLLSGGYVEGTSGAIADGGDSGMGRFPGTSDITPTIPSLPNVLLDSDQGIDGAIKGQPDAAITAVMTGGVIDQIIAAAASNRLVKNEGPHDYVGGSLLCLALNPMCFVINRPGAVRDSGTNYGQLGWEVTEIWNSLADVKMFNQVGRGVQGQQIVELTINHVGKTIWGETISSSDFGLTRLWGLEPYWSENPVNYHTFKGDGSTVVLTLGETPAAEDADGLQAWADGVSKAYTTDYTVVAATKVITIGVAPSAGVRWVFKYLYDKSC